MLGEEGEKDNPGKGYPFGTFKEIRRTAMAGCITEDYKGILVGLIDQDTEKAILSAIIGAIPLCEEIKPTREVVAKARRVAEPWGIEPVYIDEKGKEVSFSSPSALLKQLDLPLSGIQCDPEGTKCKALSVVEILRIHGYTVSGNGEPKKAAEGGEKMTVYHPKAPKKE